MQRTRVKRHNVMAGRYGRRPKGVSSKHQTREQKAGYILSYDHDYDPASHLGHRIQCRFHLEPIHDSRNRAPRV